MRFHVLTLFPEMIDSGLNTSITGRAIKNGLIELDSVNIRDYTKEKHGKVDDYPYGGGAGMVMQAEPVYLSYKAVEDKIIKEGRKKPRVIYTTPQGRVFNQEIARELSEEEDLVFLCGHYEGIDERALELVVTDNISIGDYVLTGGELPAMVMIDAISRLVKGVLNNDDSANIVIYNGGTGAVLDNLTRNGNVSCSNSIKKDISYIESTLGLIQNNNRNNNSNTQVYMCGAPRIYNTRISDLLINNKIKPVLKRYSNTTYDLKDFVALSPILNIL